MVSLRGADLMLLALRRLFAVDGRSRSSVVLEPGLSIELAEGLVVEVCETRLPEEIVALEGPGLPRMPLQSVASVVLGPPRRVVPKYVGEAAAHVWIAGEEYYLQTAGGERRALTPGEVFEVGGQSLRLVWVPFQMAVAEQTVAQGGVHAPLRIVSRYDTVDLFRERQEPLTLRGNGARLISELGAVGQPVSWFDVARALWPDETSRDILRARWDVQLGRLRHRLREAGVRPDLVRADHSGNAELFLMPGDGWEERC